MKKRLRCPRCLRHSLAVHSKAAADGRPIFMCSDCGYWETRGQVANG